ncbi:3-oxoacyl-ACP synthase [Streptomyces sp. G-G2]|nr:3-oxoacyl-ACP synthase [Streptomyces sp. G-G2]MDJ0382254.1 3-oxoacyl-ACP synthase [Streptomyces sp. G-G2]
MGAVASAGSGVDELFETVCAGRRGRARPRGLDRSGFTARHSWESGDRTAGAGDVPGRATRLLLDAVAEAAEDAGLGEDLRGIPVLVGTGIREVRSPETWWRDGSPFADSGMNFGAALRERFNADVTHTFSNGCSASLYALALASDLLGQEGDDAPDSVIVAGVDVPTGSPYGPRRGGPAEVSGGSAARGDGAAAIVLRRTSGDAARVHGRLRGVSLSCDARHVTASSRDGIAEAMRSAYRLAGVRPGDVDLVMLHGGGTPGEDEAEAAALAEVFGTDAAVPLRTALKTMTGQTSGAAGLIDLIVGIRALGEGRVPPVTGPRGTAAAAPLRFVTGAAAEGRRLNVAQLNAFGLGGINVVAIVEGGP